MTHKLNFRGVACPMNFVKTKLYLDKLVHGEVLEVILDAGEPVESVYASIQVEGHQVDKPEIKNDGSYLLTIKKIAISFLLFFSCLQFSSALAQATALNSFPNKATNAAAGVEDKNNVEEQIILAKKAVLLAPTDLVKRLYLARLLLRSGNTRESTIEYLNITVLNPKSFIAYHEILLGRPSVEQINEAIARLNRLDEIKSKQLVGTMVLSELYERKEDYYQAARVLVDLQYSHTIPQKYLAQITSRVHVLLSKDKDSRTVEKAIEQKTNVEEAEFTPNTPVPMPDVTTTDAPANKLRNNKAIEGYGHAQLLP